MLSRAERTLREAGYGPRLVPTTGPRTAGRLAREAISSGADLILAAGGDGTVNEVVEGMVHSPVPLGILPAGTANVLAMEMGMGAGLERVAARLAEYRPARIAVGRLCYAADTVRSRHFLLMTGVGLDAQVVYRVSAPLKARTGKFAYWVAGFSVLGKKLAEFHVEADGEPHTCSFALVSRVRNYGGDLEIASKTSLFDDRFEVVLFQGSSSFRYLRYLVGVGLRSLAGIRGVTIRRAASVKFSAPTDQRIYMQIDGEYAGHLPGSVEMVPDALTLLIPEGYYKKHGRK